MLLGRGEQLLAGLLHTCVTAEVAVTAGCGHAAAWECHPGCPVPSAGLGCMALPCSPDGHHVSPGMCHSLLNVCHSLLDIHHLLPSKCHLFLACVTPSTASVSPPPWLVSPPSQCVTSPSWNVSPHLQCVTSSWHALHLSQHMSPISSLSPPFQPVTLLPVHVPTVGAVQVPLLRESPLLGKAMKGKNQLPPFPSHSPNCPFPSAKKIVGEVYIHYKKCKFGGKQNYL